MKATEWDTETGWSERWKEVDLVASLKFSLYPHFLISLIIRIIQAIGSRFQPAYIIITYIIL